uniref:C2H2-type domain-containing protein n=1 Tax=viral metagenome TaxID=1070528 RepID=A0A6C0LSP9_9ZZZZ
MEFTNSQKNRNIYECKTCEYSTSRLNDYIKHNSTAKHQNAMKTGNLELNGIENFTARKIMYECIHCDYNTSHKGDFTKHNASIKHMKKSQQMEANEQQHKCNICDKEFNTQSGLWKHRKKCSTDQNICKVIADEENKVSITNNIPIGVIMEVIKQSKELQNVLIEQNKELQNKLLEQNAEHHKQLVELAKKPSMVNSNNTNNQFNLNFFLNETCKNAMNIEDFINSIKLTTHDFETTGRLGFVDGISRIFINELKRLEVERRPLHCTDVKRETVYVKDNDTWEKENQEKKKLKWAINSIAQLNLNQVQQWQQEYPECAENNTKANTKFNEMAMVALGGFGDEQESKFREKIMKNVLKEIVVSKDM